MGLFSRFTSKKPNSPLPAMLVEDSAVTAIEVQNDVIMVCDQQGKKVPLLHKQQISVALTEEAKCRIAFKISRLLPSLVDAKKHELLHYVFRVLEALVKEQLSKVKQVVAEELKDSPHASHELIMMLAWDDELSISSPVLECSPKLTDYDLVEIIRDSAIPGVIEAIAGRARLSAMVSGAVVRKGISSAVTLLLGNRGASLDSESMELVIAHAPQHEVWHEPLLGRSELTSGMVNRIAAFVSESLIETLHQEGKIDAEIYKALKITVPERLRAAAVNRERSAEVRVKELASLNRLGADHIEVALGEGDKEFVVHAMATLAKFPVDTVRRMFGSENPKVITALTWKARLPMRTAMDLQRRMAKIHHTKFINARNGTDFPLSAGDMQIFLDMFER